MSTAGVLQLHQSNLTTFDSFNIMELMKMTQLQMTLMKLKIIMKECQFHVLQCSCQMNNLENCNHW